MSSTVNSNLSELDQLLQDLNSAQFIDQVNRRNACESNSFNKKIKKKFKKKKLGWGYVFNYMLKETI